MIEVITGPMFAGKTEELIRRLRRVEIAKYKLQVFKPLIDDRYALDATVTHDKRRFPVSPVACAEEAYSRVGAHTLVVAFDEAQFFDLGLIPVVDRLSVEGRRVIIAGLDLDSRGCPFGPMPQVLALADRVTKLTAVCTSCGVDATRTFCVSGEPGVGGAEKYQARCLPCWLRARSNTEAINRTGSGQP